MSNPDFSWIIEGKLGGHRKPWTEAELLFLKAQGIGALVRLEKDKFPLEDAQLTRHGFIDCHDHFPVFTAPSLPQVKRIVEFIDEALAQGRPVGVSCSGGHGRTGTILACYLVRTGLDAEAAMEQVRAKRRGSIEMIEQEQAVRDYWKFLHSAPPRSV
jgi:atypical dual specificity phosphatase